MKGGVGEEYPPLIQEWMKRHAYTTNADPIIRGIQLLADFNSTVLSLYEKLFEDQSLKLLYDVMNR